MPEADPTVAPDLSLFRHAVDAAADGVVLSDASRDDHPIVFVNPAFERMTGYRAAEVLGRNARFLQGDDRNQPDRNRIRRALADGLPCTALLRNYRKDGTLFWNELRLSPVRDRSGRTTHWLGWLRDVTARVRLEKSLQERQEELEQATRSLARLDRRDELTDAVGRRVFLEALAREWSRAARGSSPISILLVDVDDFGRLNEVRGSKAADETLRSVAAALEGTLKRSADLLARHAGDEFAVLLPDTPAAGARVVAETMRSRVRNLALAGSDPAGGTVTVSIGVATVVPTPGLVSEDLLASAGRALRRARDVGGDRIEELQPEEAPVPAP
jgi:diguanylate cyclase (GGDEF)-like protein/PAS domain S-box-containing protein